jgi:hypothetical protein
MNPTPQGRAIRLLGSLVSAFVSLLMLASAVHAQETRATITGAVTDAQGAVVPGAGVEAMNLETNIV